MNGGIVEKMGGGRHEVLSFLSFTSCLKEEVDAQLGRRI